MKALDLFCGLGGWSDGLAIEGFDVLGVEIEPKIAELYKHKVIVADVRDLDGKDFHGYDLIVGSPPCRDFVAISDNYKRSDGLQMTWKDPKNPERGLTMVHAFLRIVKDAQPTYWLMENVLGLVKHLEMKPKVKARLSRTMLRYFWGTFPPFLIPMDTKRGTLADIDGKLRSWRRAKIPLPVARALGKAVAEQLPSILCADKCI